MADSHTFYKKIAEKARDIFQENLRAGYSKGHNHHYRFIAPASKEYTYQWLWDTGFHAIVLTHFDISWAKNDIKNFLLVQKEDGFLPHIIFWGDRKILPHWAYIESKLSIRPKATAITQPPFLAIAVEIIFEKDHDLKFLEEVLPKLALFHRWLLSNRDPDQDYLLSIISPNESGMDELPVFQVVLGFLGLNRTRLRYYYRKADLLNKRNFFNSKRILKKDYFNVEELLFNCVFIEASRSLSRLFEKIGALEESSYWSGVANKSERSLLDKCWNEKDKIFYSLYGKDEKQAKVKTITSLMPLYLDGLKGKKLEALVKKHLLNENEFWTSYPVPSVAKDEHYYSPIENKTMLITGTSLLWRGPTWINTNWFMVKGLRKHGFNDVADEIVKRTAEMIDREGFREYYNPETGHGYRRENFGWSTLILDLLDH